jgi:excinuclease ABC subunit A
VSLGAIRIVNARQHNLKGITVDLPHRQLVVVTVRRARKTSRLSTPYAEGQRRYIESLSTYAKQFLERMPKPAVDLLEGLAPAVAIEQRNPVVSSRSTVGTATEVYDYLRLLWARVGTPYCRVCGARVRRDTPASVDGLSSQGPRPVPSQSGVFPSRLGARFTRGADREPSSASCVLSRMVRSSG